MRRRKTWLWLAAALLLVGLAAFLMSRGEDQPPEHEEVKVAFPRFLRGPERQRMETRKTLPVPTVATPRQAQRPRDPLLAALADPRAKEVMVVEANALRNSPVGELFVDCLHALRRAGGADPLDLFKQKSGVDPLKDIDRVAMEDKNLVVSGFFDKANWDALSEGMVASRYGDEGRLYEAGPNPQPGMPPYMAVWRNQLVVFGDDRASVMDAIDRVEGRKDAVPTLSEDDTYGEVYGVLQGGDVLMPPSGATGTEADLARRLASVAKRVELHVDAMHDVAMVARVRGDDGAELGDLAKSVGGALALARAQAASDGRKQVAELMDYARVVPGDRSFSMEVALPLDVLEKQLAWCRDPSRQPPQR